MRFRSWPTYIQNTARYHPGMACISRGDQAAPYLSKAFCDAHFEMHNKMLAGQKEQRARWKRAITVVGGGDFGVPERFGTFGTMGFGVGQLYSAKHFPPEAKAKIQELVDNLKAPTARGSRNSIGWEKKRRKKR